MLISLLNTFRLKTPVFLVCVLFCSLPASGEDWPTRLHDIRRGGITSEQLKLPLTEVWTHTTARPPTPAWIESPARHDFYHGYLDLKPRQNFDRCFDIAVVDNFVYFGSSTSGEVSCLNAATGNKVWTSFTGGPVRFAPCVAHGKVYHGSDDGYAYCLNAGDGSLVWSEKVGPTDRMIWGNEHMISVWPVRSSLLVDGSDVFWTAGIFPQEGMYVCKRNAADGTGGWTVNASLPPQGYLLATPDYIFVPTGKTYPTVYNRNNGSYMGYIRNNSRDGGCWALLTPDETYLWAGPTVQNRTQQFLADSRTYVASVNGANFLIADSSYSYYNTDIKIYKINRSNRSLVWVIGYSYPYALIKAGDTLFAGGDGEIAAFDVDGVRIWTASVDGKAYGLAVANGCLYASTDNGSIHCFSASVPVITNDGGASNIMADSADLNGNLISTGRSAYAQASVFWGATDGGTVPVDWDHIYDFGMQTAGPLSIHVTGLSAGTNYYRFYVENDYGQSWAGSSQRFATPDDLSQWTYKMKIQFKGYDNAETLTNFPVLVIFNEGWDDFAYSQFTSSSGGDLRFTDAHETTLLNYEIEEWDTTGN
ncbi:MAG: PQQ-binding-like beta-propeller repeat protein, partial [Candidatus Neomarinimicrobiota bacterium]